MDNQNLQIQIDQLKARLDALNASSTIPIQTDQAFQNRGFAKYSITVGNGNFGISGAMEQLIPGANKTSQIIVCPGTNLSPVGAEIIQIGSGYGFHAEGTVNNSFNWMVITGTPFVN